jgi:hypothetical protein
MEFSRIKELAMYISAFLHRKALFDITNRWLSDELRPDDPLQITKIIAYDSFSAWETLLLFTDRLLTHLADFPVDKKPITQKKDLKDFICKMNYGHPDRTRMLISQYMEMPEFYYVGSPIVGYIYHQSNHRMLSMSRFKRVKRIAEKASRYASLYIFRKVRAEANALLEKTDQPVPSSEQIPNDILAEAEKIVMADIKQNGLRLPVETMKIKDVLGVKIIDTLCDEKELESALGACRGTKIVEKEVHSGNYNAVHYIVELKVDFTHLIRQFQSGKKINNLTRRGLPPEGLNEDFSEFVLTGAETVQVDLIFTSFEELIESEIGRSMHESRIFQQRQHNLTFGNIPINMEFIIEYLIAVGLSPAVQMSEIPIKLWGRYLPDTLSHAIRTLYEMPDYYMI